MQPPGQVQPFGPGSGELLEAVLSLRKMKSIISSRCSEEVHHFSVDTIAPDRVKNTEYRLMDVLFSPLVVIYWQLISIEF